MQVRTAREMGALIRDRRHGLGWTQARLGAEAGVTRAWVVGLEAGKSSVEFALVLRALAVLGLVADVIDAPVAHGGLDLDELLE